MNQLELVTAPTPEEILADVEREFGPFRARVCLCSGGGDSTVLAHRMREHYDELAFIDTGTALPGVRAHVERIAEIVSRPLVVYEAGVQWRAMILGGAVDPARPDLKPSGFPGPRGHTIAYNRLKLRQVERLVRERKQHRMDRVLLLTGVRRDESQRRRWNVGNLTRRKGAQVWAAPIVHWNNEEMGEYFATHGLPLSDVAALTHRSGECNCGSFATEGEREMLQSLWPDWFEENIASLERAAAEAGIKRCRWGDGWQRDQRDRASLAEPGPLCTDCQLRIEGIG